MLEFKNIFKSYRKADHQIKVLNGVNLEVHPGEFIAVQGASGCGKTTLLLIAGGLLHPNEGQVYFNRENLYLKGSEERAIFRAENFGFVFQQYHLVPYLTTLENVLLPGLAMRSDSDFQKAINLIDEFGLSHRKSHIPGELSAGEKQRTSLARALLHSPKVLFADEITGNLDAENSTVVIKALKNFSKKGGTVLFVTHNMERAKSADRMVKIENGNLIS
jgi:ABC-type lipoprotein export system ATPase subunit